jgi:hypothetical protein
MRVFVRDVNAAEGRNIVSKCISLDEILRIFFGGGGTRPFPTFFLVLPVCVLTLRRATLVTIC